MDAIMPSLQDFSVVNSHVQKYVTDNELKDLSNGFYYLVLSLIHQLQDDEIMESITDSHFLLTMGKNKGQDRGIDAIYIDENKEPVEIHVYNCKYVSTFAAAKRNFPSSEIDKIVGFVNDLLSENQNLKKYVSPTLYSKIEEVWDIYKSKSSMPIFKVHLCSNTFYGLEVNEQLRFEQAIKRHNGFDIAYHNISWFAEKLTKRDKKIVNATFTGINNNFFLKSDGDIRALIANIDAKDLIKMVLDDDNIRDKPNPTIDDYRRMRELPILEDAFEDNVRVYLKKRSKINRNIKDTVLSDESYRFFYYNNGITITCESFSYSSMRSPIITLKNIQVVNGSQTIHALYEAFIEDFDKFGNIDILCRIYESNKPELSTKIAEYTNSQNPVNRRDIRSIDFIQQKLEQDLLAHGYFYERKREMYSSKPKNKRIDSEKVGQVLLAFYHQKPSEAKNKKQIVFADMYDAIFNDDITADKVLLAYELFIRSEEDKINKKKQIDAGVLKLDQYYYVYFYAYWLLYFLQQFADKRNIKLEYKNIDKIWGLKPKVVALIEYLRNIEKASFEGKNQEPFREAIFFKSGRLKILFDNLDVDDKNKFY